MFINLQSNKNDSVLNPLSFTTYHFQSTRPNQPIRHLDGANMKYWNANHSVYSPQTRYFGRDIEGKRQFSNSSEPNLKSPYLQHTTRDCFLVRTRRLLWCNSAWPVRCYAVAMIRQIARRNTNPDDEQRLRPQQGVADGVLLERICVTSTHYRNWLKSFSFCIWIVSITSRMSCS